MYFENKEILSELDIIKLKAEKTKNNLIYKSNPKRVVGQSNSSDYIFKSSIT